MPLVLPGSQLHEGQPVPSTRIHVTLELGYSSPAHLSCTPALLPTQSQKCRTVFSATPFLIYGSQLAHRFLPLQETGLKVNQPASFAVQLNGARGVIDAKVHTPAGVVEECYVSELDSGE